MLAADEAEARGDAVGALEIMQADLLGPDGKPFWRPWRMERLLQLAVLGPVLPGWVTSRWVLAQALQTFGGSSRDRVQRALQVAIEQRGGPGQLRGVDLTDARCRVIDRDWVYRQVFLYELGGLQDFIRRTATPDLLAGADQIAVWAASKMGGYRFVRSRSDVVTWEDVVTGEPVSTANIGSHVMLEPGDHVIGRLVPTVDGPMFESVPLRVPEAVAGEVADCPPDWLDALRRARAVGGDEILTAGFSFDLCTDVPPAVQIASIYEHVESLTGDVQRAPSAAYIAKATWAFAAWLLADPEEFEMDEVDYWACLAGALLRPAIFHELAAVWQPGDAWVLNELSDRLAEPASRVLCDVAAGLAAAA